MTSEALNKKQENDSEDSIYEDFEIILTEEEAESLVKRLEKGSNDKVKSFLKESTEFYEEMKLKADKFKK